jgi:hypothetical protein
VVSRQPETRFNNNRIGSIRGCLLLALKCKRWIEDLHFHDLRHEAVSRLFELGLTVPEVALISGRREPTDVVPVHPFKGGGRRSEDQSFIEQTELNLGQ